MFVLSDGANNATLGTDPLCAARLASPGNHTVAFVADAGPR